MRSLKAAWGQAAPPIYAYYSYEMVLVPKMNVVSTGPASDPRVVCLHGFLGDGEDWRPLVEYCGGRYRFDLVDLPGHGSSTGPYDFAACVAELSLLAQGASALVGYSMGGRLALATAVAGVPSLRALVIVSASPGLEDGPVRAARLAEDERRAERLEAEGLPAFVRTWYDQPLFASLARQPALRERLTQRRSEGAAAERASALRGLSVGNQPSYWGSLGRLGMPSLWVAGEEDAAYTAVAQRAVSLSGRGRALIVPSAGHMPHIEQPAGCLAGIAEFLEQHLES